MRKYREPPGPGGRPCRTSHRVGVGLKRSSDARELKSGVTEGAQLVKTGTHVEASNMKPPRDRLHPPGPALPEPVLFGS